MKKFLSRLIKENIHVSLIEGELSVKIPNKGVDMSVIEEIKSRKQELITYLSNLKKNDDINSIHIDNVPKNDRYSISNAQHQFWILSQFEGGLASYNMFNSVKLEGNSNDINNFKRSIWSVLERHEILRTVFQEDSEGIVHQMVLKMSDLDFVIGYENYIDEENPEECVKNYIQRDSYVPFNLKKGLLFRVCLLQLTKTEYVFYYNMHHIISDGWSMEVLSRDVFSYYKHYSTGAALRLPELRIQYKDYAAWQLANLETNEYKVHKNYWVSKFSGDLPVIDLPSDKQRPVIRTHNGKHLSTYINKEDTSLIKNYIEQNEGTLFMFLIASLKVLLHRYTGEEDIIIGSPIAGRDHSDLEDQIGPYVNTLVLRNNVKGSACFHDFFNQVKQELLGAYMHQMYPFDRLVEELGLKRSTSRSALFDILVVLQNKIDNNDSIDDIKESIIDNGEVPNNFDIEFNFNEIGQSIRLDLTYNTDVYDKEMITNFITHYRRLIRVLILESKTCINKLDYLQDSERNMVLYDFNNTSVDYPDDKTIIDLMKEQVARTPNAIAIVFKEIKITYKEVDELSNQLANYLLFTHNIKKGDVVGVKLERNEWSVISVLAILKTGAAYVPIRTDYPEERIEYIEKDSHCRLIVDIDVLETFKTSQKISKECPGIQINTQNLAYVMYTSGSTGQPKGVMISHKNISNLLYWFTNKFDITEKTVAIQLTDISFDPSIEDIFGTLIRGGVYHVVPKSLLSDINTLREYITYNKITILNYIPRYLFELLGNQPKINSIGLVICGGEKLQEGNKLAILNAGYELYNNYGPTETTVDVLCGKMNANSNYIGKPIHNTKVYILDVSKQIVPVGVPGELCVSGKGLSKGYLNRPQLTENRFIQNPFDPDQKLYLTGDIVKWTPDGNVIFIGRKDNQVKVRGYRIELAEIEKKLSSQKNIDHAVVLVKEENNEKLIVAFLVGNNIEINHVKLALRKQLPDYMIPSYFKTIDDIPLNSNGKIDNNKLLNKETFIEQKTFVPPSNEIEVNLVNIWEAILEIKQIGVKDNFFDLGGNSMKAIQIVSEVQRKMNVSIEVNNLFEKPNIEELAIEIANVSWQKEENKEEDIIQKLTI